MEVPLIKEDLSLKRYTMGSMTSWTSPNLFIGMWSSNGFDLIGSDQFSLPIFVRITVGLTLFTRIFWPVLPSSKANDLVSRSTPAFEALYSECPWKARELARDETFTMLELILSCGTIDWQTLNTAFRFTPIWLGKDDWRWIQGCADW